MCIRRRKKHLQFLKIWTLKESCFKCSGDIHFDDSIAGYNFILDDGTVLGIATNKFFLPNNFCNYQLNIIKSALSSAEYTKYNKPDQ